MLEYVFGCEGGMWLVEFWVVVEEFGFIFVVILEFLGGVDVGWFDLYVLVCVVGCFVVLILLGEVLLGNWLLGQVGFEGYGGVFSIVVDVCFSLCGGMVEGVLYDVFWGWYSEVVVVIVEEDGILSVVFFVCVEVVEQSFGLNVVGELCDDLYFSLVLVLVCVFLLLGILVEVLLLGGVLLCSV